MTQRVLVSHKLREIRTGNHELDAKLNEWQRAYTAEVFERFRYHAEHSPDHEITEAEVAAEVTPDLQHPSDRQGLLNIKRFGAGPAETSATNLAALQTAISVLDEKTGGGMILVPGDCNYGFESDDFSTHPDFTGITEPITVIDYSPGNTYSGYPTSYDGMQVRYFFHTPQTTSPGQHDGNGILFFGNWHPNIKINNTGNYADADDETRTANDNRRASLVFQNDSVITYRLGQGTQTGASFDDDEMSFFTLESWNSPLSGAGTAVNVFIYDRVTGALLFGADTNATIANYWFKSRSTSFYEGAFEAGDTVCEVLLRNSDGSGDDVVVRNNDGALELFVVGVGAAVSVRRSDRAVLFPGFVRDQTRTVASLPSADASLAGCRTMVTDANAATFNSVVAGGGSNVVPVFCDGSDWRIG